VSRLAVLSEGSEQVFFWGGGGALDSGYLADQISMAETGY